MKLQDGMEEKAQKIQDINNGEGQAAPFGSQGWEKRNSWNYRDSHLRAVCRTSALEKRKYP